MKRCDHDQLQNIQIPYLEVDKYHCTQNPATKKTIAAVYYVKSIYPKDREASNLPLCYLTGGYLDFRSFFSLLVVDCQLVIIEFLVIHIDVI